MGYIIGAFLLVVILAVLIATIRPGGRSAARREKTDVDHPLSVAEPAADEPTPGMSDTTDPTTVQKAQRRVPPA